jgi:predicted dinucleotide-binding enzyme
VLSLAKETGFFAIDAGFVKKGERKVIITPLGIELDGESLVIR